jgi:hypothetical protein
MAIRADSYSSSTAVAVYTRYITGNSTGVFNSTTIPTGAQVVEFVDEASGVLNMAIRNSGFSPANVRANSTAKLACDSWVRAEASIFVELTQRGVGYSSAEGSRTDGFDTIYDSADEFIKKYEKGFENEGITRTDAVHQGLKFTAKDVRANRSDPTNTDLEQPKFRRSQWDNK